MYSSESRSDVREEDKEIDKKKREKCIAAKRDCPTGGVSLCLEAWNSTDRLVNDAHEQTVRTIEKKSKKKREKEGRGKSALTTYSRSLLSHARRI